jgi:hypothetical protein
MLIFGHGLNLTRLHDGKPHVARHWALDQIICASSESRVLPAEL